MKKNCMENARNENNERKINVCYFFYSTQYLGLRSLFIQLDE